ncbi:S-protein homolog 5-like [Lactuca sativa]|uniref:S-protein homolog 5-like n=1 Tax=Lactuca sativa TaxID=4236 RepID=UPI000CD8B748|nr:S-protein homolog 5-like [Lactuca sativa]
MHNVFIFVILASSFALIAHSCFTTKWDVSVRSNVHGNIVAHIKSGDTDFGNHTIPFNGNYTWSFGARIDGLTLDYGYFWWGSRFQSLALYDNHIRDICYRGESGTAHCYWLVTPNGFYVSGDPYQGGADPHAVFIKQWS